MLRSLRCRTGNGGWILLLFLLISTGPVLSAQVERIAEEFHNAGSRHVMVASHRGAHRASHRGADNKGYPENSLASIRHAIALGVDIVELDVRLTSDSVTVLMHDETIDRTTKGTGKVSDYSWSALQQFRLKNGDGSLSDETIPAFRNALRVARGHILVDIDLKTAYIAAVVADVRETGTGNQVLYFDNNYTLLQEIRRLDGNAMIMPRAYSPEMTDSAIRLFHPPVVHIDRSFYNSETASMIRNRHARIWINTLGLPDLWIRLGLPGMAVKKRLKYGATVLQTDEPEKLLTYLDKTNRRSQ